MFPVPSKDSGRVFARQLTFLSCFFAVAVSAQAASVNVMCGTTTVGAITVNAGANGAISGGFASSVGGPPATEAAALAACGEDHFNWYQIVTATNGTYMNRQGVALTPPFIDPPSNGLAVAQDPTWADNLPWYYDEYAPAPGTPNYVAGLQVGANTTAGGLSYFDQPGGNNGLTLSFSTWLVSLNKDGSFDSFHSGFSWDFSINGAGAASVTNIQTFTTSPTNAQYTAIKGGFLTSVPEPSTISFLLIGSLLVMGRRLRG